MAKQPKLGQFMFKFPVLEIENKICPNYSILADKKMLEKQRSSTVKYEPLDAIRVDLDRITMKTKRRC